MGTQQAELEAMQLNAHYTNTTAGKTRATISDEQITCLKSQKAAVLGGSVACLEKQTKWAQICARQGTVT